MFSQVTDFLEESEALHALLAPLEDTDYQRETQFRGYTIQDVVAHLHHWNVAADLSLTDEAGFQAFFKQVSEGIASGRGLPEIAEEWLGGLRGRALLETWRGYYRETAFPSRYEPTSRNDENVW